MNSDPVLASQAASLRAGVAGVIMIVVICFGAAFAFSDRAGVAVGDSATVSATAGAE
ncbi:MAG: hypothetical protein AAFR64_11045 [Pseudomonadota bacterium]